MALIAPAALVAAADLCVCVCVCVCVCRSDPSPSANIAACGKISPQTHGKNARIRKGDSNQTGCPSHVRETTSLSPDS